MVQSCFMRKKKSVNFFMSNVGEVDLHNEGIIPKLDRKFRISPILSSDDAMLILIVMEENRKTKR